VPFPHSSGHSINNYSASHFKWDISKKKKNIITLSRGLLHGIFTVEILETKSVLESCPICVSEKERRRKLGLLPI